MSVCDNAFQILACQQSIVGNASGTNSITNGRGTSMIEMSENNTPLLFCNLCLIIEAGLPGKVVQFVIFPCNRTNELISGAAVTDV